MGKIKKFFKSEISVPMWHVILITLLTITDTALAVLLISRVQ